jgi:TonB-dependent receptor
MQYQSAKKYSTDVCNGVLNYFFLFTFFIFGHLLSASAQQGSVTGTIKDAKTGERLIGATIAIQGTTRGTISDFDGNYSLNNIDPGTYNLIYSFVSYNTVIKKVSLEEAGSLRIDLDLEPSTVELSEVQVVSRRRMDTEMSLISSIRASDLIVSGISAQQIAKTMDKDAAEVIRRIPGITISDNKFVIVRGLMDRYNNVLLNGSTAPSFESDKRAFAFDAMPSGIVDNILIFKSLAPEIPADFAGAVINVITKSNADQNSFKFSYTLGYNEGATFKSDFQKYKGGKTDWLGFDDGTRALPAGVPSSDEFEKLYTWPDVDQYRIRTDSITMISKEFNKILSSESHAPFFDQNFSATLQRRFLVGRASLGNITSVYYKTTSSYYELDRREFNDYDIQNDTLKKNFEFRDYRSRQNIDLGLLHNWLLVYGDNQKMEFRNFLNNMGESGTMHRSGQDYYDVETIKAINLRYNNRFIYSGQLAGSNHFNSNRTRFEWMAGFNYTRNYKPDDRRLQYVLDNNRNDYYLELQNKPTNVKNGGRLYIDLNEKIYNLSANLEHNFAILNSRNPWLFRTGFFYEKKQRTYEQRLIGLSVPRSEVPIDFYQLIDSIVVDRNFFFDKTNIRRAGLAYGDGSKISDNYNADGSNLAGYAALKIPLFNRVDIYGGVRAEHYQLLLNGFYDPQPGNDTLDIERDFNDLFPSINVSYEINEDHVLRVSYGKTTNRPEYREISPVVSEDFDLNALVYGNTQLKPAYIHSFDLRYEWYPTHGEIVSVAAFYKDFSNPIESFQMPSAGTGFDYRPFNTEEAYSAGIELDIRKTLQFLEDASGIVQYLKDITLVLNTSFIKSEINTDKDFAREKQRIMQGQSPYIINLGVFYNRTENGLGVNVLYNRIGKRIAYAGTPENPHTWELPRNSLDLLLSKSIGKRLEIRLGYKDILGEPIRLVQYWGPDDLYEVDTYRYIPNSKITVGMAVNL